MTEDHNQKINLEYLSIDHEDKENQIQANYKNTESVLYLLMKHDVSMKFYHELSIIFKDMPRIKQVAIAI